MNVVTVSDAVEHKANLPVSRTIGPRLVTHWNVLLTRTFRSGLQVVPGAAFSIGVGPDRGSHAVFLYLSVEHPFRTSTQ